ncbi:MAG TPA: BACON domain-containing carbohydrate-binding protein [Bacteroidales bacterium]|nr:BACON domain-containing carbohydrate-binding protein [Bacteroidales bacterium]
MKKDNIKSFLLIAVLSMTLFASCSRSDQTGYLVVAPVKLNMPPVTTSRTVTVRSSESWFIEQIGNEDWCTVFPDKGTPGETQITVTVTPMPGVSPRIALFSVTSVSGLEKFLEVEQTDEAGANYFLEFFGDPNPSMLVYPRNVEPFKFFVNTNTPSWNVVISEDDQDWLTAERKDDTLYVYVADVDRPEGRKGTVTASAGGSLTASISFNQMGLHDFGAPTTDFSLPIPGVPDSDLAFSYVYRRSRYTMLVIWGTWCTYCNEFLPKLKELYDIFAKEGFNIYGVALEEDGNYQQYFDYIIANGLDTIDVKYGKTIGWENRPVFNPLEQRKINDFTRLFYGDALLTGEVVNYLPAFFIVDSGGNIRKIFVDRYTTDKHSALFYSMRKYLEKVLECCGG